MKEITFNDIPELLGKILDRITKIEEKLDVLDLEQPKWLDTNELREYLPGRPPKATIYYWTHRGMIPHHKMGRSVVFLASEIEDWLMSTRVSTAKERKAEKSERVDKLLLNMKRKTRG